MCVSGGLNYGVGGDYNCKGYGAGGDYQYKGYGAGSDYLNTSRAVGLRPTRHGVAFFSRFALAKRKYASAFGLEALNNFGVMKQHWIF